MPDEQKKSFLAYEHAFVCLTFAIGMRPGRVEALAAADRAERVLGPVRVERVRGQAVVPPQQPELVRGHDEVDVLLAHAH